MTELDYLFIGAHPDDIEIFAGGFLMQQLQAGSRVGILDLTAGELGTYGSAEKRLEETTLANQRMGVTTRERVGLADGFLEDNLENRLRLIPYLRGWRPELVISFSAQSRHPDHLAAHHLVRSAAFLAGVEKYAPETGAAHRPSAFLEFDEPFRLRQPDFVVDITAVYEKKRAAVLAYDSQVLVAGEAAVESKTLLRSPLFWQQYEARARWYGALIGVDYGEGYSSKATLQLKNPLSCYRRRLK